MPEPYCRASLLLLDNVILELAWEGDTWRFHAWDLFGISTAGTPVSETDRERRFETIESAREFFREHYGTEWFSLGRLAATPQPSVDTRGAERASQKHAN